MAHVNTGHWLFDSDEPMAQATRASLGWPVTVEECDKQISKERAEKEKARRDKAATKTA